MARPRTRGPRSRGPLDPGPDAREAALAARWRRLRDGLPSLLYLLGCAVVVLAVLATVGWVLSRVVHDDGIGRADASLSRFLAARRSAGLNDLTVFTSEVGGTLAITAVAVIAVAVMAVAWRRWREPMLVVAAVAGEVVIFLGVTMLVDRERPPVPHLDEAPPTSSFPSGHTAASIALYGALAVVASERARSVLARRLFVTLAVLLPLLVAASRMYRGMHFLTDVLGGVLLGSVWLLACVSAIRLGVLHYQLRHEAGGLGRLWRGSVVRHG
jgi:undecaprenyl-diphosphatase